MAGMRDDLKERFKVADEENTCVVPCSSRDAQRLRRAYKRGEIISPAPQVYAPHEMWERLKPLERESVTIRALSELHPDWVFAGPSAAIVYGLYVSYRLMGKTYVATDRKAHSRSNNYLVRTIVKDDEINHVEGVPVTSLVRTAYDCMRQADFRAGLSIADSTLRVSGMDCESLVEALKKYDYRYPGHKRALGIAELANGLSENGGESTARAVMYEQGFMIPTLQKEVFDPIDPSEPYRVDFYWQLPGVNVAGELDGREKYSNPVMTGGRNAIEVLADERLRESRLTGSKDVDKVMRFSFSDVVNTKKFSRLLTGFGIPGGYQIPWVAKCP